MGGGPPHGLPNPSIWRAYLPLVETAKRVSQVEGCAWGLIVCPPRARPGRGHGADENSKDGSSSWALTAKQGSNLQKQIPGLTQPDPWACPTSCQGCPRGPRWPCSPSSSCPHACDLRPPSRGVKFGPREPTSEKK